MSTSHQAPLKRFFGCCIVARQTAANQKLPALRIFLFNFQKLEPDPFGSLEETNPAPVRELPLFEDLGAARFDLRHFAGEILGVDRDMFEAEVLLQLLAGDIARHVERHAVKIG